MKKRIVSFVIALSICCTLAIVPARAADFNLPGTIDTLKRIVSSLTVNTGGTEYNYGALQPYMVMQNHIWEKGYFEVEYSTLDQLRAELAASNRDRLLSFSIEQVSIERPTYVGEPITGDYYAIRIRYTGEYAIYYLGTLQQLAFVAHKETVTDPLDEVVAIKKSAALDCNYDKMVSYEDLYNLTVDYNLKWNDAHFVVELNDEGQYWAINKRAREPYVLATPWGYPYCAVGPQAVNGNGNQRVVPEEDQVVNDDVVNNVITNWANQTVGDGFEGILNYSGVVYDESSKTYYYDSSTHFTDSFNTTYYYNFAYTFNIEYTSITYIGASEEYTKTYDVYYELPDGRSSADLTKEELEQLNLEIDVINYGRGTDDTRLRSLYHFDGNTEDSSYWNYCTSFDWNDGASLTYLESNSFNGCLYLDELTHDFTLTLPSSLGSGDFTLDFRYYQSATLTPQLDSYITVGGQRLMQLNGSHFLFGGGNYSTPVGNWNHLAIVRENGVVKFYLNGVLQGSTSLFSVLSNQITFHFGADQQTYKYLDEIRVTNFPVWTANFSPSGVPYDTNLALILPTDSVPVADEYWSIDTAGENLLSEYNLDWWDSQHSDSGSLSDYFSVISPASTNSRPVASFINNSSQPSYSASSYLYHSSTISGYPYFYSFSSPDVSSYTNFSDDSVYGFRIFPDGTSYDFLSSGFFTVINCNSKNAISAGSSYAFEYANTAYLPLSTYTFSMVSSNGEVGAYTFDLNDIDLIYPPLSKNRMILSYSDNFVFNGYIISLSLASRSQNLSPYTYAGSAVLLSIIPTDNPGEFVYLCLEEGTESTVTAERVSSIVGIPQENLNTPTLAVRTDIPVTDWQIGGIRPTFAERGMVYAMVENGYITSLQIYSGYAWLGVDGRIWTGSRWIPYSSYNVITLSDMYDIADASGQSGYEYIYTETGFWSWFQKQWLEFKGWYSNISFNGGGNTTINETTNNHFNDTEYSNDVTVFNVTKDSGKSMWDLIKGVLDIVGGVFSETGDAVDGMSTALSEPEDDTSVWYIFDVPYEYMSPVGEGD